MHPALGIGLLGGFTTYSAFALESVALLQVGNLARATVYVVATNVLGIGGSFAGGLLGRALN